MKSQFFINHRSIERILTLGEVFTPPTYVDSLLDQIGSKNNAVWADENITFFEPTCGHGNIVISLVKRRLNAIYKKALKAEKNNPCLYTIANTINTLWAIDLDEENIKDCRQRVLLEITIFLKERDLLLDRKLIKDNPEFFAHLFCALKWQIHQNECLSAMSSKDEACKNSAKTKSGFLWFRKNGHHPLDFETTWCEFFKNYEKSNLLPREYKRGRQFISALINGKVSGYSEFDFAQFVICEN